MMTISQLYDKYYTKSKKGFLAYDEFTTASGIKVCLGFKENRRLAIKIGSRRWGVKKFTLRPDKDPQASIQEIKTAWKQNVDKIFNLNQEP